MPEPHRRGQRCRKSPPCRVQALTPFLQCCAGLDARERSRPGSRVSWAGDAEASPAKALSLLCFFLFSQVGGLGPGACLRSWARGGEEELGHSAESSPLGQGSF